MGSATSSKRPAHKVHRSGDRSAKHSLRPSPVRELRRRLLCCNERPMADGVRTPVAVDGENDGQSGLWMHPAEEVSRLRHECGQSHREAAGSRGMALEAVDRELRGTGPCRRTCERKRSRRWSRGERRGMFRRSARGPRLLAHSQKSPGTRALDDARSRGGVPSAARGWLHPKPVLHALAVP